MIDILLPKRYYPFWKENIVYEIELHTSHNYSIDRVIMMQFNVIPTLKCFSVDLTRPLQGMKSAISKIQRPGRI